jgi:uncharacterized protein Yka (UPF0111/DUF47 family)
MNQQELTKLEAQYKELCKAAYRAAQSGNAKSYGKLEREIEAMERKIDELRKS